MANTATELELPAARRAVWRDPDFARLWAAQSVSLGGTEVTRLALPLAAALALGASPLQMALLAAAEQAPFLLCSLPAGVLADRVRRRPLLLGADLGRAALLLAIPLAAVLGLLRLKLLYAVAFGIGVLSVIFEVAHYAYVPELVPRALLTEANSRIQFSYSVAESAGPGLGGLLVRAFSAPLAVLLDSVSYLISALLLRGIRAPEAAPARPRRRVAAG